MGGGTGTIGCGLTLRDTIRFLITDLISSVSLEEKRMKSLEAYLEGEAVILKDKRGNIRDYRTSIYKTNEGQINKIYVSPRKGVIYPFSLSHREGTKEIYKYQGFISGAGGST